MMRAGWQRPSAAGLSAKVLSITQVVLATTNPPTGCKKGSPSSGFISASFDQVWRSLSNSPGQVDPPLAAGRCVLPGEEAREAASGCKRATSDATDDRNLFQPDAVVANRSGNTHLLTILNAPVPGTRRRSGRSARGLDSHGTNRPPVRLTQRRSHACEWGGRDVYWSAVCSLSGRFC